MQQPEENCPVKKLYLIACSLMWFVPALAQQAPVPPALPATTMTIRDCKLVLAGLRGLDGHQVISNAGKPNEQVLLLSYEFNNADLRRDIQTDIAALVSIEATDQKVQQDIYREVAGAKVTIAAGSPEEIEYGKRVMASQDGPCNAQLSKINIKDLRLDKNEVPGTVLGALDKILVK
jgi:hypothetical protein